MFLKSFLAGLSSFGFKFLMRTCKADEGGLEDQWFKGFGGMISLRKCIVLGIVG